MIESVNNFQYQIAQGKIGTDGSSNFGSITIDKQFTKILGLAITFSKPECIPGSVFALKINGKLLFNVPLECSLFTFSQACPVDDRYFTSLDQDVDQALIEGTITCGSVLPVGASCGVNFYFICK